MLVKLATVRQLVDTSLWVVWLRWSALSHLECFP